MSLLKRIAALFHRTKEEEVKASSSPRSRSVRKRASKSTTRRNKRHITRLARRANRR